MGQLYLWSFFFLHFKGTPSQERHKTGLSVSTLYPTSVLVHLKGLQTAHIKTSYFLTHTLFTLTTLHFPYSANHLSNYAYIFLTLQPPEELCIHFPYSATTWATMHTFSLLCNHLSNYVPVHIPFPYSASQQRLHSTHPYQYCTLMCIEGPLK